MMKDIKPRNYLTQNLQKNVNFQNQSFNLKNLFSSFGLIPANNLSNQYNVASGSISIKPNSIFGFMYPTHDDQASMKSTAFNNFVQSFGNDKKTEKKNRKFVTMNASNTNVEIS